MKRLAFDQLECRALLTAVSWTGDAGDNNWDTPGNWSPTAVPTSTDDVTINIAANIVHSSSVADSINSLTSTEPLTFTAGSLAIANASSTTSTITINGGTLTANGSLAVGGTLTLTKGTLSGTGTVNANGGMTLDPGFNVSFNLDTVALDNASGEQATWSGGSNSGLTFKDGATFNNLGNFVSQSGAEIYQGTGATGAFNNDGSFTQSAAGGATIIFRGVPFNTDDGSVDVKNTDTLSFLGGGTTVGGTLTSEAGCEIDLGGTQTFDAASTIQGAGTVEAYSGQNANLSAYTGVTTVNGTYNVTGTTTVTNGGFTSQLNLDGTIKSLGSTVSVTFGNTLNASVAFTGAAGTITTATFNGIENFGSNNLNFTTLSVTEGTLTFTGTITVSGVTTFGPATIGAGIIDADGGITVLSNNFNLIFAGTTLNNGVGQAVSLSYGFILQDGAVFNNYGTLTLGDNVVIVPGTGTLPLLNNYGTVIGAAGSGNLTQIYVAVTNIGGTVEAQTGTLQLNGRDELGSGPNQAVNSTGGTITAESGAELDIGGNGTLDAATTVNGAGTVAFLSVNAAYTPSPTVTVNGPYDVTGTTNVGSGFDDNGPNTLNLDGPVTSFGSTLNVTGLGTLNINSTFPLGGGLTGAASIAGQLNLGSNNWNPTSLTVSAGGIVSVNGTINVSGFLIFPSGSSGGEFSGTGIVNANGGIGGVNGGGDPILSGVTLNNPVGQSATFEGGIEFKNGGVFNNHGTLTAAGTFYTIGGALGSFNNYGTWTLTGTSIFTVPFNANGGTVNVGAQTLSFEAGGSSVDGTFTTTTGGQIAFGVSNTSHPFTIDANTTFSGGGGIYKEDESTLILPGTSTLTGATTIVAGTYQVDGTAAGSPVTLEPEFQPLPALSGTGTVGAITAYSTSTVSPGDPAQTGILTADGNVTLESGSNFAVALNGATAGSGYDQLNATGTVTVTGSNLVATLGYLPSPTDVLTIIKSPSPIVGTFSGLPEGATIAISGGSFGRDYTISYVGGSSGHDITLTPAFLTATSTSVSSSLNPADPGQTVTFTAIVAPTSGTGTPTGTVTFSIDGIPQTPVALAVVGGNDEASLPPNSTLSRGSHVILATYNGDSSFATSTSFGINQIVGQLTEIFVESDTNPANQGQAVTFTAVVAPESGGTPTGTGTFSIDGTPQTPVALAVVAGEDQASLPPDTSLSPGNHTITAMYNGDPTFNTSTATPITQVINPATLIATTTALSSSLNPADPGQPVTFTAIVTPTSGTGAPSGTVTFTIDGTPQTPVFLAVVGGNDQASLPANSSLTSGNHIITATYNGDESYANSTATNLTQNIFPPSTTILGSSVNPSSTGQAVTFSAIVSGGDGGPTGTVTFSIDGHAEAPVTLQFLNASSTEAFLPPDTSLALGSHTITATFNGDNSYATSTAAPLTQVVNGIGTTITLSSSPNPTSPGQAVTFTAVVAPTSGTSTPTGTVTFTIDGTPQTPVPLVVVGGKDQASLPPITNLSPGTHIVTAAYNGDTAHTTSNANAVTQVVTTASSPTVVSFLRYGYHSQATVLVLTFNTPLAAGPAQNVNNYQIVLKGGHAPADVKIGGTVAVTEAVYNPSTMTVMLFTAIRLNIHNTYQLTVNGMTPNGLTGATGIPIAGAGNVPGTNYVTSITMKNLAGKYLRAFSPFVQKAKVLHKVLPRELKVHWS